MKRCKHRIFWYLILSFVFFPICEAECSSRSLKTKFRIEKYEFALYRLGMDIQRFPTTDEGLKHLVEPMKNEPNWKGPYINHKRVKKDPWSNDLIYIFPAKYGVQPFDLYSIGINETDDFGSKDDISNWKQTESGYYSNSEFEFTELIILILTVDFPVALLVFIGWRVVSHKKAQQMAPGNAERARRS